MAKEIKAPAPVQAPKKELSRNKSVIGHSSIFTPQVIDDIHIKSELGRYRMRGFSLFKKIPNWDDLTFLPGTLTRFVIEGYREKCETQTIIGPRAKRPLVLDIPVYITGMSFGSLSYEAKISLARGATMAGTATCSGEGGMIPDERRYSSKWLYQCIQSRYGFNPHHLRLADACEFFIGQGCKVGLGGHLMGQKVTDQVAEMRSLPAGIDQRSPARHPDWLGPDDLALKINEIREATNGEIPIQLKLGAARVYDDVRMAARRDLAGLRRRHPQRRRRRQGAGARGGRGRDRPLGADGAELQQGHSGGGLREGDRGRGRPLLPLPHGPLPGRRRDPGSVAAQAARSGCRRRARVQLPALLDDRGPDDGARLRQDQHSQP